MGALLLVLLLFPNAAGFATTTARVQSAVPENLCRIDGIFSGITTRVVPYRLRGRKAVLNKIFWKVEIRSRSANDPAFCPAEAIAELRVRGADLRRVDGAEMIDYPVHISEPARGAEAAFRVQRVSGKDTLTGETYAEWLLREVVDE